MAKHKALGKGLSALIPEAETLPGTEGGYFQCPIEEIEPNPFQPRQSFEGHELDELVASIKEKGIITPLLVSRKDKGYRLIAGERRWRAAQKAGLTRVPVVIRESTPVESLELALIENIHRKDLNPIEEASAYSRCLEDGKMTQQTLAKRLGKDRSTITNMLRLLRLPQSIQKDIIENRISMGHARALAGIKSRERQMAVRDLILRNGLSVRQVEALAKQGEGAARKRKGSGKEDYYLRSLAEDLKRSLGTKVEIKKRGKHGRIVIHFYSSEELDRLLDLLS
ncbi:MAG: ParB/RepB/Spo0J family partition protein [Deltaproteobacteria bacterium]|nr:ParB/RepB/Spo0J family partition protein [Deltaproteobacteria bacterium]MBW1919076.1 ParB/RepB/Spo0J family partition protein [Deltaproteobacteria bacterium]MBW1935394.1 ParB/RepB/Spo0J family partition protein [Deltaproteobacteria bacterium]MBW1976670.1 ParB/RepB/Spo0J family partition protein [Deltaproteobacteria bacterium]MBW2043408.1 ParB/RepB/Spo0J family partition protein [Deltaproteobacteria bacterium]